MKKTLLILIFATFLSVSNANAQTVWDFGNSSEWPESPGYAENTVVNNLGFFANTGTSTNYVGAIEANNSGLFSDDYSGTKRLKLNGASYESGTTDFSMPTKRYLFFAVTGACTVKVWFRTGGGGNRNLYVTDGTSVVGTIGSSTSGERLILTANYTGGAGNLYIGGNEASNIMKIQVSTNVGTTTLNTDDFQLKATTNIFSNGKKVFVSNVQSETEVKVYNITGQLIKSFTTTSEIDFPLDQGMYIVNVKSGEGAQKSVKVLLN
ncbi:hypothetical protein J2X31_003430 [Flavobacterium arsenatis]|uniref:Secretion system C-terminal sorting domain-containing protein n=1 Tax=Flavobacterium arsenatis TaxID=1484332 RepID=A0ABU1TU43_9FLAO|nr:T9SS type A sorting domain-containing protein [Flavobacterium arsenatis]MDR6969399.1 hypothetical protein [Flavobacterium arsenatis]